jgi:hypothetical protein
VIATDADIVRKRRFHFKALRILCRVVLPADADKHTLRMRGSFEQVFDRVLTFRIAVAGYLDKNARSLILIIQHNLFAFRYGGAT